MNNTEKDIVDVIRHTITKIYKDISRFKVIVNCPKEEDNVVNSELNVGSNASIQGRIEELRLLFWKTQGWAGPTDSILKFMQDFKLDKRALNEHYVLSVFTRDAEQPFNIIVGYILFDICILPANSENVTFTIFELYTNPELKDERIPRGWEMSLIQRLLMPYGKVYMTDYNSKFLVDENNLLRFSNSTEYRHLKKDLPIPNLEGSDHIPPSDNNKVHLDFREKESVEEENSSLVVRATAKSGPNYGVLVQITNVVEEIRSKLDSCMKIFVVESSCWGEMRLRRPKFEKIHETISCMHKTYWQCLSAFYKPNDIDLFLKKFKMTNSFEHHNSIIICADMGHCGYAVQGYILFDIDTTSGNTITFNIVEQNAYLPLLTIIVETAFLPIGKTIVNRVSSLDCIRNKSNHSIDVVIAEPPKKDPFKRFDKPVNAIKAMAARFSISLETAATIYYKK